MPKFAFEAHDTQGRAVRGTREADDQNALLNALRARELVVTRINLAPHQNPATEIEAAPIASAVATAVAVPVSVVSSPSAPPIRPPSAPPPSGPNAGGVAFSPNRQNNVGAANSVEKKDWSARANSKQMSLFFRQMHAMLHAGTSISQALALSSKHDPNASLRRASSEMSVRTGQGEPWSETMRRYPGVFSELMIGLTGAGESSGTLDTTCARLSQYAERDYEIQQTIKRETWYPKLLVLCAIFIPSVVTLVLQGFGAWLGAIIPQLLGLGAIWSVWKGLNWLAPLLGHEKGLKRLVDGLKLVIPVGGKVTRGFATAKFCRAMAATYSAGVAPHRALQIAANACDNAAIGQSIEKITPGIERGDGLTSSLASTKQFPPIALQMMGTGEETGQIDTQLDKVADFLESDAEMAVKQSVKVLGILVFLLVALQIGSQVVSFYSGYVGGISEVTSVEP